MAMTEAQKNTLIKLLKAKDSIHRVYYGVGYNDEVIVNFDGTPGRIHPDGKLVAKVDQEIVF